MSKTFVIENLYTVFHDLIYVKKELEQSNSLAICQRLTLLETGNVIRYKWSFTIKIKLQDIVNHMTHMILDLNFKLQIQIKLVLELQKFNL